MNKHHHRLALATGAVSALAAVTIVVPCSGQECSRCLRCIAGGIGAIVASLLLPIMPRINSTTGDKRHDRRQPGDSDCWGEQ